MLVYFAHGYVVRDEKSIKGDKEWKKDSRFAKVFFSFEEAKEYLLNMFNGRIRNIYLRDPYFQSVATDLDDVIFKGEYIRDYIEYDLTISEINPDIPFCEFNSGSARQVEWVLDYKGELLTRYVVLREGFGVEFRPSDELPDAGTKFKVGDLVSYKIYDGDRSHCAVRIITKLPLKTDSGIWLNHYDGVYIEDQSGLCPVVRSDSMHEADICLYSEERLQQNEFKEQIKALQKIVKGEVSLPEQLRKDIFSGKVLFNAKPSWRDIDELK